MAVLDLHQRFRMCKQALQAQGASAQRRRWGQTWWRVVTRVSSSDVLGGQLTLNEEESKAGWRENGMPVAAAC